MLSLDSRRSKGTAASEEKGFVPVELWSVTVYLESVRSGYDDMGRHWHQTTLHSLSRGQQTCEGANAQIHLACAERRAVKVHKL